MSGRSRNHQALLFPFPEKQPFIRLSPRPISPFYLGSGKCVIRLVQVLVIIRIQKANVAICDLALKERPIL